MLTLAFDTATDARRARSSGTARCSASAPRSAVTRARGRRRAVPPRRRAAAASSTASSSAPGRGASPACGWGSRRRARSALALDVPAGGRLDARRARRPAPGRARGDRRAARRGVLLDGEPRVLRPEDCRRARPRVRRRRRRPLPRHARAARRGDPAGRRPRARPAARFHAQLAERLRPGRRGRADLPARSRREAERARDESVRLQLDGTSREIEQIERESYPTPWSRSMFAGELAKASSVCLGAFDEDDEGAHRLPDRLALRRRLARDEHRRRPGASARRRRDRDARAPLRADGGTTAGAATRSRCASRTTPRSISTSASASSRAGSAAATTPTTARTR